MFSLLYFEISFLKNEKHFKKTGKIFLVESTTMENATFSYKTTLPITNVKTNRMGSTNGPITTSGVLSLTTLFFQKFNFNLRTSKKWATLSPEKILLYNNSTATYIKSSLIKFMHNKSSWTSIKNWKNRSTNSMGALCNLPPFLRIV